MLVGEQPGDKEDLAGHPFVGPAGKILDSALEQAGISRGEVFVTNAVKHFKHEMRGKRRLHKRPNLSEIERCRWWLERERAKGRPGTPPPGGARGAHSCRTGTTRLQIPQTRMPGALVWPIVTSICGGIAGRARRAMIRAGLLSLRSSLAAPTRHGAFGLDR
jgi:hypothetical protein